MSNYTLYGTPFSMYTGKVKSYLSYKKIPFEEVFSSANVFKTTIKPNTGNHFIPVVKTPDDYYIQDSSEIIERLEVKHPQKPVYPLTPKQRLVSILLELYGDEWLLLPAMHYRWNFKANNSFIYQNFGRIVAPNMPAFIRGFLGKRVASRFKGYVPKLGITGNTIPSIEKWFQEDFLQVFDHHLSNYQFLLGDAPSIADFAFYGPLGAHLSRDPYPKKLIKQLAPNVVDWVERMENPSDIYGDFLPDDEIPETLLPILVDLFDNQWPVLEDTSNRLSQWYSRETNGIHLSEPIKVPRVLGKHKFTFGEVEESRSVMPFSQWMMQKPLEYYQSLKVEDQQLIDPLLKKINGLYAMRFQIKTPVLRINNRFVIE